MEMGSVSKKGQNKKIKSKKLSTILKDYDFKSSMNSFVDSLIKKRDWENLKDQVIDYQKRSFSIKSIRSLIRWEKMASKRYYVAHESALEIIDKLSKDLSDETFEELKVWISVDQASMDAWKKSNVSIEDRLPIIKARIVHLIYMMKCKDPSNLVDLINN